MWTLCMRMLHIRRMAFPLRSFKQHPSVSYYLNFSSICLCVFICNQGFFRIPPWSICSPLHALRLCFILFVLFDYLRCLFSWSSISRYIANSIVQSPLWSGWKSYGSGILTQLQHYIPNFCQLSSIDGFHYLVLCSFSATGWIFWL